MEHIVLGVTHTVTLGKTQFKDREYLLTDVQSASNLHLGEGAACGLHYKTHNIGAHTETGDEIYLFLLWSYPFLGARTTGGFHRIHSSCVYC